MSADDAALPRPLEVAARAYHWKPGTAWFRALELDTYLGAETTLEGPTLDLGCGDGRVGRMLAELGIVGGPIYGVDPAPRQLADARDGTPHAGLARADGGRLPFPSASFASVVCSPVLHPGPPPRSIGRVLRPGGTLIATFPSDRFDDVLYWPRVLRFWPAAARAYTRRMNERQPHYTAEAPEAWRRRFEDAGLTVERTEAFISRPAGRLGNLASMHVFRFIGLLKLLPGSGLGARAGALLGRALRGAFERERERSGEGYLLFVARARARREEPIRPADAPAGSQEEGGSPPRGG